MTEFDCHPTKPPLGFDLPLDGQLGGGKLLRALQVSASVVMGSVLDHRSTFSWIAAPWFFGSFGTQGLAQTRSSVLHSESVRKSTMSERSTRRNVRRVRAAAVVAPVPADRSLRPKSGKLIDGLSPQYLMVPGWQGSCPRRSRWSR
jgi:hypothetical protein